MEVHDNVKHRTDRAAEPGMRCVQGRILKLFADRSGRRWIVLDSQGEFWELPFGESSWDRRRPIDVDDDLDLEPIPGHYKHHLGLPA